MGISSALFASVSGLSAISTGISTIADNVANVNTSGFKSSKVTFADLLSQSFREGVQIGRGSQVSTIEQDFSQGSFEISNNPTDLAIDGDGFFVLSDGSSELYTRSGQFSKDSNGELVNPQGLNVQGFQITSGVEAGSASDISFATTQSAPSATTEFQIGVNLNVDAASGTATFRSAITVFDSLGDPITLTITFSKASSGGTWNWAATASDGTVSGGGTGVVTFDSNGNLATPTAEPSITISGISTGAANLTTTWNLLNAAGATNGSVTGFAADSVVNSLDQNGFASGSLRNLSVDASGIITGLFTNGESQQLYRLSMVDFTAPSALTKLGRGAFGESATSGQPIPGSGDSGGLGAVTSNALELSNVDLAQEFVNMITAQRAFQANTRVITTIDNLLSEVVNLKR